MKGTYILVIKFCENAFIKIGKRKIFFKTGYYFYIGSALGSYGSTTLLNRVKRHLKSADQKRIHWHIDYLLKEKGAIIVKIFLIPSNYKLECEFAQELIDFSDGYIENFGNSDCNCKSHLVYFREIPKRFL